MQNMQYLEQAKALFKSGGYTCVLWGESGCYTSSQTGVAPMLAFLEQGIRACAVADKIVGKAAAMLFCCAGVELVYAEVLSQPAEAFLREHGILVFCETKVDSIINRTGTGPCPMEQAVLETSDPQEGYRLILETRSRLMQQASKN